MTKQLTKLAAAVSISCGLIACSSSITAEPWYPKKTRSDAQNTAAAESDSGQQEDTDEDAGE